MSKGRLEAFSDGVIAIIITIMVLEMKVPHGEYLDSIAPLWPVFLSYVLSFLTVAIYWNNHHHMLHSVPATAYVNVWISIAINAGLAGIWFIPDRRFERRPETTAS